MYKYSKYKNIVKCINNAITFRNVDKWIVARDTLLPVARFSILNIFVYYRKARRVNLYHSQLESCSLHARSTEKINSCGVLAMETLFDVSILYGSDFRV